MHFDAKQQCKVDGRPEPHLKEVTIFAEGFSLTFESEDRPKFYMNVVMTREGLLQLIQNMDEWKAYLASQQSPPKAFVKTVEQP